MCGVFGFVSTNGGKFSMASLRRIAFANQRRGRDAWGMAWIGNDGILKMHRSTGAIGDSLSELAMASDAKVLIGHTRYATQGCPLDNNNNHPHQADDGYIVHNGMIPHYRRIVREYGLAMTTDCDSEVLARLIEQSTAENRLKQCIDATNIVQEYPLVMLGIWPDGTLSAIRDGNPLWTGTTNSGMYLSSLDELPGTVVEFPNGKGKMYQSQFSDANRKVACGVI
jgi:glucosamine--fructose-6-phosphate aminotransferase (isomerizing)